MTLLSVNNMKTNIGQYAVLHDVSFDVPEGGVFVLLGRNGAGKTTTLRSIMGLWSPSPGSVRFRGQDITAMHTADIARMGIAFVPENMGVFGGLTVEENLVLATARGSFDKDRLDWIWRLFPALKTFWTKQAWSLSGGQKQMLSVARAIIEDRDLILIDEPTKGLAPSIIDAMADAFQEISRTSTILLVEQRVAEALQFADHGYVLETGRGVLEGDSDALKSDDKIRQAYLGM